MRNNNPVDSVSLSPLDEMFGIDTYEAIKDIEIKSLMPFNNHPFRQYSEGEMEELVHSIDNEGLLQPIVVREAKDQEGKYEIIIGHSRVNAFMILGLESIPATIRNVGDEEAIIMMVDSNLRMRRQILPSEKAKAYAMKVNALKRQGRRTDLSGSRERNKLSAREIVALQAGELSRNISKYIRLNELIPRLLEMVDNTILYDKSDACYKLGLNPAVEISYISKENQETIISVIEESGCTPTLAQAQKIRELDANESASHEKIYSIITEKIQHYPSVKIKSTLLRKYFKSGTSEEEMMDTILRLLERWKEESE